LYSGGNGVHELLKVLTDFGICFPVGLQSADSAAQFGGVYPCVYLGSASADDHLGLWSRPIPVRFAVYAGQNDLKF